MSRGSLPVTPTRCEPDHTGFVAGAGPDGRNRLRSHGVGLGMDNIRTIGTIGAGQIGTAVARLAVAAGYDVVLSNSRGPETLADLVDELGPRATADTPEGAATRGDLVVVTIPLRAIGDVPVEPLAGKIVVDTNNYYSARDGHIAELDDHSGTSAGLLQRHLPDSRVVKAFNHIQAGQLEADGTPSAPPAAAPSHSSVTTRTRSTRSAAGSTSSATTRSSAARSPRAGGSSPARPATVPGSTPTGCAG